jgi:hypothetical protein
MHSLRKIGRVSILTCAVALLLGLFAADAAVAGQQRSPIPGRLLKVKEGDWILIRTGEGLIKETATGIEETEADPENNIEPFYMVLYTLEKFDPATGKPLDKPLDVARALDYEQEENLAAVQDMVGRPERRRVKIDGRNINVVVIKKQDEGNINIEEWYSDEIGIDGRVAMVIAGEDMKPYTALEAVAFGDARTPLNINKYLSK